MATEKEREAQSALQQLGLEIADRWASGFEKRPTQQLVLQKIIDPAVKHILSTIFPWVVGVAILFLVLLTCTVVTCYIVLSSGPSTNSAYKVLSGVACATCMMHAASSVPGASV
jgi:hypothetical protein